jgi:exopolyphosphatase/guanosine-5'-triphosphate,3'-diphosphate pyrophosphatase
VAAVDLGSNSFHMLVARTDGGEPVVVDRLREMVQLASGVDKAGRLSPEIRERALECLRKFGERVRHMPSSAVRAVGTNTLRILKEGRAFRAEAEDALGHTIETISGIEEARLIYLGVTQALPDPETLRLVVDIGGGSTELIVGEGLRPRAMESLYMGSITLSRTHFPDGVIDAKTWERAELAALQELEPVADRFRAFEWREAVGASGTIRAVDRLVAAEGWDERGITPQALKKLREALLRAGRADRLKFDCLNPQRRPFFAGGAVIITALFKALAIERMRYSEGALREGLLYDLLGRIREDDVRSHSVEALADRYHVDWKQAARVECTALKLLVQVADDWKLSSPQVRQFLAWASQLHEIGLDIAHDHYHRHGEYVVAHCDLLGFSRSEQQLLATLVRAHRRKFPVAVIRALGPSWARAAERLAILFRLAVVLHRSRSPAALPEIRLSAMKRSLAMKFPQGWLDDQPLTRADLETEAAYLEAAGYGLVFD